MSQESPPPIIGSPPIPDRADRTTFSARATAWADWLKNHAVAEIAAVALNAFNNAVDAFNSAVAAAASAANAAVSAVASAASAAASAASAASALAAPGTSASSTTSLTIGLGAQSLTIEAGKALVPGQTVTIANTASPIDRMIGPITAYDSGTGALDVFVEYVSGAGTASTWTIGLSASLPTLPTVSATVMTASYNAVPGDNRPQDTSGGGFELILPASPARDDAPILVLDDAGTFVEHPLTINPNGNNLYNSTEYVEITNRHFSGHLVWTGSPQGWMFI